MELKTKSRADVLINKLGLGLKKSSRKKNSKSKVLMIYQHLRYVTFVTISPNTKIDNSGL